jgi:hypothetical protein
VVVVAAHISSQLGIRRIIVEFSQRRRPIVPSALTARRGAGEVQGHYPISF